MPSAPKYDYVICARELKGGQFTAEPGPLTYLRVPRDEPAARPAMQITQKRWVREVRDAADGLADEQINPEGDILIFVHGYNNDIRIIMKRQRRLQDDMAAEGWRGVVVAFDWPSDNSTLNYLEDRQDAAAVASLMVSGGIKVIAEGQTQEECETNIHLIGHSTGAYAIMEAFAQAEKDGELFKSDWRMGQVALIGGDVSADSLGTGSDWAKPMYRRIMRLTNYSNGCDTVLAVSNAKRLGTAPRVGRIGLPGEAPRKAVNVDCTDYFQTLDPETSVFFGTFSHSWHIGNPLFTRDLAMTLEGRMDRAAIPTRRVQDGRLTLQEGTRPAFEDKWHWESGEAAT